MSLEFLSGVTQLEQESQYDVWTKDIFISCMQTHYDFEVLLESQKVIGFIISATAANETHLINLRIKKSHQKQTLGELLVTDLIKKATAKKSEKIFLEVRKSNLAARALYAKMAFVEIGRREDYYPSDSGREDAIVLALTL